MNKKEAYVGKHAGPEEIVVKKKKEKKKIKIPFIFISLLIVYAALLVYAGNYCFGILEGYFRDYEISQSYNAVDEYLEHLKKGDYSIALECSGYECDEFNDEKDFIRWYDDLFDGDYENLSYLKSSVYLGPSIEKYNLYKGEKLCSYLIVEKNGEKTDLGFDLWTASEIPSPEPTLEYSVTIPEDSAVYVNGTRLDEKYLVKTETLTDFPVYLETRQPEILTYSFGKFIFEPEIEVRMDDGTVVESDSGYYERPYIYRETIEERLKSAVKQYILMVSRDGEVEKYLSYIAPDTDYYNRIYKYHSGWIMYQAEIDKILLGKIHINDYREFSDIQISMNINYIYQLVSGSKTETFESAYKVYYMKIDGKWMIVDMLNN